MHSGSISREVNEQGGAWSHRCPHLMIMIIILIMIIIIVIIITIITPGR